MNNNVLKFNNLIDLEEYINNTFTNKEDNIKSIIFKFPHTIEYKFLSQRLVEEAARGKITWEIVFSNALCGDWECAEKSISIIYIDRYIKTKDKMIFKTIEKIETY